MASLQGKVAVVTGASRGIDKGTALTLAAEGMTVYVTGRTVSEGEHPLPGTVGETAALCDARGGKGIAIPCDLLTMPRSLPYSDRCSANRVSSMCWSTTPCRSRRK